MRAAVNARTIRTPAIVFHAVEAGTGPLVLCLHGFPDVPGGFAHQLPALAAAGFHAVAPAMRGYAPTGPAPDGRYDGAALAGDVLALLDALEAEEAVLFGHDWGAAASYFAALTAPGRVRRLVTAAVPYGPQFFRALGTDPAQQKRSWYMLLFQQGIAAHALAHDDFTLLERLWRDWSPGWAFTAADLEELKGVFREPGMVDGALGYYRQVIGPALADPATLEAVAGAMSLPLEVPAMVLHGADDGCIDVGLVEPMRQHFPRGLRVEIVPGAGHFVHRERPDVVNRLLLDFLAS